MARNRIPKDKLQAFEAEFQDLFDEYHKSLSSLQEEAFQLAGEVFDRVNDTSMPELNDVQNDLRRYVYEDVVRRANRISADYYMRLRGLFAEAMGVDLGEFTPVHIGEDRAAWKVFGGLNKLAPGTRFRDVLRKGSKYSFDDMWRLHTQGFTREDWEHLAAELVRTAGRLTVETSGREDKHKPRWARVPTGPSCSFCALTASQGYVYLSAENAMGRHGRFHAGCDCRVVPKWGDSEVVPSALFDQLARMGREAREFCATSNLDDVQRALRVMYPEEFSDGVWNDTLEDLIDPQWRNQFTKDNSMSFGKQFDFRKRVLTELGPVGRGQKVPPVKPIEVPEDWDGNGVILTSRALTHIVYGGPDTFNGGHLAGYGWIVRTAYPGKLHSEFPENWSVEMICDAIASVIRGFGPGPLSIGGRIRGEYQGVTVEVVISTRKGQRYVRSSYPVM